MTSCKQLMAHCKYHQVKTHVQTACDVHDLNMDFCSYDTDFKQLCMRISIYAKIHISELISFSYQDSLIHQLQMGGCSALSTGKMLSRNKIIFNLIHYYIFIAGV